MAKKSSGEITPQQERFCHEYLIDLNGAAAARRAGFSEKSAKAIASQFLAKPQIQEMIVVLNTKRLARVKIDGDQVLKRLDEIGDVDIAEAYDQNGKLKPIHDIPIHIRKAISSIKVYEEYAQMSGGKVPIGEVREIRLWNKVQANELLGRHKKLFTDKVELTDKSNLAERLERARRQVQRRE